MLAFLMMAMVFAVTPGPAMVYTVNQAIAEGKVAGLKAALGIHLASYFHIVAAATGLALLIKDSPRIYVLIQLLGCGYLIGLGLVTLIRKPQKEPRLSGAVENKRWLSNAFVVELFNPKSALFFLSFLPQFTHVYPAVPAWLQILIFGALANVMFSLSELALVLFSQKIHASLQGSPELGRLTYRMSGAVLILVGSHLAFAPL
ncbi:LysE family translocator [Rhizobium sp. L1K21]|uniref:LysE family translocator n=1 Tax=Rhizobium sp. L1K21 TaxID=2954933 RepID=UPI00209244BA|nr:LysE family translocator [Rhizobium sp. L1K21]MCO6187032.1 LysE family translocator [Rhizobium sp. L1K21]